MRLGTNLDPDNLRTGNDVYFECEVKANPVAHRLIWLHNVSLLLYNFLPRVEQGLGQFYTRYSMYSTHVQCTVLAGRIDSQDDTAMSAWWATILKRQCHEIVLHFLFYESNSL